MAKLSKDNKKQIDQAIRRLERKFEKAISEEKAYAEKNRIKAPTLKMPSRKEIYERIDPSTHNWAEQVAKMSTVEVYQPKSWGKIAASDYGRTSGGVSVFDVDKAIEVMKASKVGLERRKKYAEKHKFDPDLWKAYLSKDKREASIGRRALLPSITPLRNVTYIDEDTASKMKRTKAEEDIARRLTYLNNLRKKAAATVFSVSPELAAEIDEKLAELIGNNGRGSKAKLAELKVSDLATIADDTNKKNIRNTIKNLMELDLGDFTSGLASIVGYDTMASKLLELMTALGMSLDKTYDGMTVEEILGEITQAP